MGRRLTFDIPQLPTSYQVGSRIGRSKDGKPFVFVPAAVRKNADTLAALIAPYRPETPLEGPIRMTAFFYFPWRASDSKRRRMAGARLKDTSPDSDNLLKQLADVLEKSGFLRNDAQLADVRIVKQWSEPLGIRIEMEEAT